MFQLFMAFLVVVDLLLPRISTMDVLAFMEYLAQSGMSPDNITNHITGIRSISIVYGIDTTPFRDQRIPLFIKSLKINRPLAPVVKILIDQILLLQIVTVSAHLQSPFVYTALYLLAFFPFSGYPTYCPMPPRTLIKRGISVWGMWFLLFRGRLLL